MTWEEANTLLLLLVSLQALFATWESRRLGAKLEVIEGRDREMKALINEELDKPAGDRTGFDFEGGHYTVTRTGENAARITKE